jgi:hypothetical protein
MRVLNILTSPRKDQSASRALVDAFLREYMTQTDDIVVDTLDVWQEWLPEFDAETINAKYKCVSGESMTPAEITAWEKIRELASISAFTKRRASVAPKILEPHRRQFGIAHCMLDVSVAEVSLQCPGVVPPVCKCVTAGVSEHMRMGLQAKLGLSACALDHASEAGGSER